MSSEFSTWLGSGSGIACACLAGIVVVIGIIWFIHWRTAFRSWEGDTAAKLTAAGVPAWATDELVKGSQGNIAGAIAAAKHAVQMFMTPAGQAEFDTGILMSAYANPTRRANLTNIWNLLTSGASTQQVQAAVQTALQGSPVSGISALPTLGSVAKVDLASAMTTIQTAIQNAKATGTDVMAHIHDSLNAAGLQQFFPLVASGATAQAVTGAVAGSAAGPVGAAAGAAAGAVDAMKTASVTLPPGHSATISNDAATVTPSASQPA